MAIIPPLINAVKDEFLTAFFNELRVNYWLQGKGQSQWPHGPRRGSAAARLLGLWLRIPPRHGWLSLVSVVCCQVEASAAGWSLVQRSHTECCVLLCDCEASIMRRICITRSCGAMKKNGKARDSSALEFQDSNILSACETFCILL